MLTAALSAFLMRNAKAAGIRLKAPESGLSAQLDATDGNYQLTSQDPAWTLGGSLGLLLTNMTTYRGRDNASDYQQIAFEWWVGQVPMRARSLLYTERAVALFSQTCGAASETAPVLTWKATSALDPLSYTAMSKYSVLVVGMGNRGMHHATAFTANPKFQVTGICDIDPKRLDDAHALAPH